MNLGFWNGLGTRGMLTKMMNGKSLLPYLVDFSTLPDGALPTGWIGSTWAISSGKAVNTPTVGSELITNGDMSSDVGWSVGADWSIGGGIATKAATGNTGLQQTPLTLGKWYQTAWQLASRTAGNFYMYLGGGVAFAQYATPASYVHAAITAGAGCGVAGSIAAAAGTVDNVSAKEITPSSMIAVRNVGQIAQDVWAIYDTFTTGTPPMGVAANVAADRSAGLAAFVDGTYIYLYKWIGATWTQLIKTGQALVAGVLPEIKTQRSGANLLVDLLYNGAAKGTQQTVSDAQIINNTYVGLFSSYGGNNKIASFFVQAP